MHESKTEEIALLFQHDISTLEKKRLVYVGETTMPAIISLTKEV
jgi:hypothetical protein